MGLVCGQANSVATSVASGRLSRYSWKITPFGTVRLQSVAPSHYAQCPFSSAFQRPLDRVGFSPVATEMDHRTLGSKGNFLFLFLADLPTLTSPDDGNLIGEISSERRVMLKFCIFQEQQSIPRSAALHAISVPARRQHLHSIRGGSRRPSRK